MLLTNHKKEPPFPEVSLSFIKIEYLRINKNKSVTYQITKNNPSDETTYLHFHCPDFIWQLRTKSTCRESCPTRFI